MPHLGMGELVLVLVIGAVAMLAFSLSSARASSFSARRRPPDTRARGEVAAALPRTPISEVRAGDWVRVGGQVAGTAGQPELRAPLSGAYGVAHRSVVRPSGPVRPPLVAPALDQVRAIDFLLRDETGRARVVARGARPALALRPIEAPRTRVEAWLERHGVPALRGASCHEAVLERGAEVEVEGRARWEDDDDAPQSRPDEAYRRSVRPRRLVLEPAPGRPLLVAQGASAAAEASVRSRPPA